MKVRNAMVSMGVAVLLVLAPPDEASAATSCTQDYLLCINDASQEDGWFWRTAMEVECGIGYYGCLRSKASGG